MKKAISVLIAIIMIFSLASCSDNKSNSSTTGSQASSVGEKIKDRQGNEIEIPSQLNKIISTSPSNTEILVGLGLAEKIIATDTFSTDIKELKSDITKFDMQNLDMEKIIALKPDAIFVNEISLAGEKDKYKLLKDSGIQVIYIPAATSLQNIMDDITFISKYTKTEAKGTEYVNNIKSTMDNVSGKVKLLSSNPPKVYFEISAAPYLYSVGKNTFLNEIITLCGGVNIYADQDSWIANTEESVFKANPDIILSSVSYDGYSYKEILSRNGWNVVNAVKNNKVYLVDANSTSRASQNIVKGIMDIAKALHPDLFE